MFVSMLASLGTLSMTRSPPLVLTRRTSRLLTVCSRQSPLRAPESAAQIPAAKKRGFDIAATSHLALTPIAHTHVFAHKHQTSEPLAQDDVTRKHRLLKIIRVTMTARTSATANRDDRISHHPHPAQQPQQQPSVLAGAQLSIFGGVVDE